MNPEEVEFRTKPTYPLKHFAFRGKCAFNPKPTYRVNEVIKGSFKKYPVKAFNHEGQGKGLKILWERVLGYSKK
jgi:hypothetical protein